MQTFLLGTVHFLWDLGEGGGGGLVGFGGVSFGNCMTKLANFTQMTPPPPLPPSKGIFWGLTTPALFEKGYTWSFYTVRRLNISERNGASKKRKLKELIIGNKRTESTNALKATSDANITSALQIPLPTRFPIVFLTPLP